MKRALLLSVLVSIAFIVGTVPVSSAGNDYCSQSTSNTIDGSAAESLAQKFAPAYYFHQSERYYPTSFRKYIELADETNWKNSNISLDDLSNFEEDQEITVEDSGSYTGQDVAPNYIYASVHEDVSFKGKSYKAITYWSFYIHDGKRIIGLSNGGSLGAINTNVDVIQHTSDLETLTILLRNGEPQFVGASQHYGGEIRRWEHVQKVNGTHPKLYPALDAHSVYFVDTSQAEYDGDSITGQGHHLPDNISKYENTKTLITGLSKVAYADDTGNGTVWKSDDYNLRVLDGSEPWQSYKYPISSDGNPKLPKHRDRWSCPGKWMDNELVSDESILSFAAGWPWLSSNGELSGKKLTVKPRIKNTGPQPHAYSVRVKVISLEGEAKGQVIGRKNVTVRRKTHTGQLFSGWGKIAAINLKLSHEPDCAKVKVTIANYHSSAPSESETFSKKFGQVWGSCSIT